MVGGEAGVGGSFTLLLRHATGLGPGGRPGEGRHDLEAWSHHVGFEPTVERGTERAEVGDLAAAPHRGLDRRNIIRPISIPTHT